MTSQAIIFPNNRRESHKKTAFGVSVCKSVSVLLVIPPIHCNLIDYAVQVVAE